MERSNEAIPSVILDTDVIVNWLTKERETDTGRELWKAPHKIIAMVETRKIKGLICLTSLLELRYLLRRKKEYKEEQIEAYISQIMGIFEVIVPDEISLLRANSLQAENLLDPFDAILLSFSISVKPATFISRDTDFLKIAKRFIEVAIPEDFSF